MARLAPRTPTGRLLLTGGVAMLALTLTGATAAAFAATTAPPSWVDSWGASPQSSATVSPPPSFTNQTLRLIVHLHAGGTSVRVRLANTFGDRDITFDHVTVALRTSGAAVGTTHRPVFSGAGGTTPPKATERGSHPVPPSAPAGQALPASPYVHTARGRAARPR